MKKLLSLTLALLLLSGCAPAAYDGPTKSAWVLTEYTTTFFPTEYFEGSTSVTIQTYDARGNLVLTRNYDDGELSREYKFRYNDQGHVTSRVIWDHDGLIPLPDSRDSYTYDDLNRPLTITHRNGFGIKTGSEAYTYDDTANTIHWEGTYGTQTQYLNENGSPIRITGTSKSSGIQTETTYEYNAQGLPVKITDYIDGSLTSTMEYRYDDQGRTLEYILRDPNGTISSRSTYVYEENTVTILGMDGSKTIKTLRPDGQPEREESYYADGTRQTLTEYTYQQIQIPANREE